VLDLYAGSGALGIEALSRGATSAVFVDRSPKAVAAIRANLEALGIDAPVRRMDARAALRPPPELADPYDLVFLDPPYRRAAELGRELSEALPAVLAGGPRRQRERPPRAAGAGLPARRRAPLRRHRHPHP
jgi:16S rRNA (guanine966-N2)-methyltransferase